jgi:hypothetical protein
MKRNEQQKKKLGKRGMITVVRTVLCGRLLVEEQNGPGVIHNGSRVERDGMREVLGGVGDSNSMECDGLVTGGGKRV